MKKRKKYFKVLLTFVLVVALFTVQGLQIAANAKADISNPTVIVNNGDQFVEAIQNAQDGDIIGLGGSCISIDFPNNYKTFGSDDKHIYLVRMNDAVYIEVNVPVSFRNMTIDGNGSVYQAENAMIKANTDITLDGVTMRNCSSHVSPGGALSVRGTANINNCTFDGNSSGEGGHIYASSAIISNSTLQNGNASRNGGAICHSGEGTISISGSKIYNNSAGNYGGGIYNTGNLSISSTVIFGNTASNGSDIANTREAYFQIDSLDDVRALYEAEDIIPKE